MRWLFFSLLVLLAAVIVAQFSSEDPGFVVIGYHGRLLRTSVNFFVFLLGLLGVTLYLSLRVLAKLWSAPRRLFNWSHTQRSGMAQKALLNGVVALAEGNWERAEGTFSRNAATSECPLVHYLAAARAAHSQRAWTRRDEYLRLAEETNPQAQLAVGLTKAELQLHQGQWEQAKATLQRLRAINSSHPRVLKLSLRLLTQMQDWGQLLDLLPALKQRKICSAEEILARQTDAYVELLANAQDADGLSAVWSRIPNTLRRHPAIIEVYAARAQAFGQGSKAIPLIQKALKSDWDPALVKRYGLMPSEDLAAQINAAEKWLGGHGDDATLLLSLGRLCYRSELWGKACYYLEACIKRDPAPEAYWLLAETLDHIGDPDGATEHRRLGLELAARAAGTSLPVVASEG
ncbi:MAG: heme biosynthesis HemY N-terminal domain-containing protein [Gammaproteobacteria bacterium]